MKRILFGLLLAIGLAAVFSVETDAAQHEYFVKTTRHGSDNFPSADFTYDYKLVMEDVDGYTPHPVIIEYIYTAGEGTNLNPSEYSSGKLVHSQVHCFYSKSDGTYRPFDDKLLSPSSDGYVSYNYYYSFSNNGDFNDSESDSMGAFMSAYYDSTTAMNIPVLHVPYSEKDKIEQIVADYFINGGSSSYVVNKNSLENYPLPDEDNIVYDERLGYLKNCRVEYWKDGKKENLIAGTQNDEAFNRDSMRYEFTWNYVPSSGAAAEIDKDNGFNMGDLVNAAKSVRVQMRVDFTSREWMWQDKTSYTGMMYFSSYGGMPLSTQEKYSMKYDDLYGKMELFAEKTASGNFSITNVDDVVFYLRLIRYSEKDGRYHTGKEWVRLVLREDGNDTEAETGYFDKNGNFIVDNDSEDSYSMKMDPYGNVTGGNKVPDEFLSSEEKLKVHEEDGWDVIDKFIDSMKSFPAFMTRIFSFLPESLRWAVGAVFLSIVGLGVIALVVKILT